MVDNMIIIYTVPKCKYCIRAKEILNQKCIKYEEINLADPKNRDAREYYRSLGVKFAPIIKYSNGLIMKEFDENKFIEALESYEMPKV